ncbi:MAG: leucine--tRNA ligase [Candidatus Hadarchaeales archaeon]
MDWTAIDARWQEEWRRSRAFEAAPDSRKKFYLTVAYPYVSGPMHIGHGRTYTVPDVIARYKRMRGFNVLFPMAYHFTGTPIVGAAKRVARRDPDFVRVLVERYGIPEYMLEDFENPHYYANYFARESDLSYRKGMELLGLSIDWRREFTTIDPHYSSFVTWQYNRLWRDGLIVKGRHPVKWCPGCGNPVTDHDLLEGEGVEIVEFTLLKYRMGDLVLPAATLRPETVFGVTNLWLNPEVKYVRADVDGEKWIVSEQALEKLRFQGHSVGEAVEWKIEFGEVEVPLTHKKVPILPAKFVDPDNATGVVGSVPAHAPYDYIALLELQREGVQAAMGLSPVPLIEVDGYGEAPAADVVKRMGIVSQQDGKLDEATLEVYRAEFARGKMMEWVPKFGGMQVSRAKDEVKAEMIRSGEAATMYEFSSKPVRCRCGSKVMVKVVEDQWFLNYADSDWKSRVRKCIEGMHLVPPESRAQFEHTVEWLKEWPCTRKISMGTPAPWDREWIIESLSDSTIYMAYYTISHILKTVEPGRLTDEVFDYVFHGKGDPEQISRSTGIERDKLDAMRQEFSYWYPLDYRMSANELIPNHLTFHVFHHVQIFPDLCPKGIVSFGMAILEGQKMSSSKGNIIPINAAVKEHGADAVRLYLLSVAEPWQDMDWRSGEIVATRKNIEKFYSLAEEIISMPGEGVPRFSQPERWMMGALQKRIVEVTNALENFETRKAIQSAFFSLMQDLRWYMKRAADADARTYVCKKVLNVWLRLMAPFIPHVCEELWSMSGGEGLISLSSWPEPETGLMDRNADLAERYLVDLIDDISKIRKTMKKKPSKVCIYVAQDWKWNAYRIAVAHVRAGKVDLGRLARDVEERLRLRLYREDLFRFLKLLVDEIRETPEEELDLRCAREVDEFRFLIDSVWFIGREIGVHDVQVWKADDPKRYDPQDRSRMAVPFRPAIYIE